MTLRLATFCLLLSALPSFACGGSPGWKEMASEAAGQTRALVKLEENGVPLGKPFSLDIKLCGGGKPVDRIKVDAVMPLHKHGMNYRPKVTQTSKIAYRASGMYFHMPGLWRLSLTLYGAGRSTNFTLDLPVE